MTTRRILVVDDDVNATRMIKLALERTGHYKVRELNDPIQALWVAREFKPDLVLMDICMPGKEGMELAFQLRGDEDFQAIPIVFLTSLISEREAMGDATTGGSFHFIAKPTRLNRVITCIERSLETAQGTKQHVSEEVFS
jgi:DNA-binding response OmpR family regulator